MLDRNGTRLDGNSRAAPLLLLAAGLLAIGSPTALADVTGTWLATSPENVVLQLHERAEGTVLGFYRMATRDASCGMNR